MVLVKLADHHGRAVLMELTVSGGGGPARVGGGQFDIPPTAYTRRRWWQGQSGGKGSALVERQQAQRYSSAQVRLQATVDSGRGY